MKLFVFLLLVVSVRCITFDAPVLICEGNQPYVTGYRGFAVDASQEILGPCGGALMGSLDGGKTWQQAFDKSPGSTITTVVPTPGTLRTFGSLGRVKNPLDKYTSFSANNSVAYTVQDGKFVATSSSANITFQGFPVPVTCGSAKAIYGCPFRLSGTGWVQDPTDGAFVTTLIVYWGGGGVVPDASTSVVAFRSMDAVTWDFAGVVANASAVPTSQEGPNENSITLLPDGKTILAVIRLDAGDGLKTHPYTPYVQSMSKDGGRTWSPLVSLGKDVGCARPRLRTIDDTVVLSGGRLSPTNRDIYVWTTKDLEAWDAFSITYWHNKLETNTSRHFTPAVNASTFRETTSYTSLVKTSATTGLLTYSRVLESEPTLVFGMPFSF